MQESAAQCAECESHRPREGGDDSMPRREVEARGGTGPDSAGLRGDGAAAEPPLRHGAVECVRKSGGR